MSRLCYFEIETLEVHLVKVFHDHAGNTEMRVGVRDVDHEGLGPS
jgi:hypothetical protein